MRSQVFSKKTSFISIEISIRSQSEAPNFIKWFESQDNYVNKVKEPSGHWFIYCDPFHGEHLDAVIAHLCDEVKRFTPEVLQEWNEADERFFDIGFSAGEVPNCFNESIQYDNMKKVTEIGAYIKLSIYPAEPTDNVGIPESCYTDNK